MKCGHGQKPGGGRDITVHGGAERAVEEHEKRCRGARVFWHPGSILGIARLICCATCGKRIR